mgnify:CR=1 FL=1
MITINYYNEIKNQLIENEINKSIKEYSINRNDLQTYYNVGKLLVEAQGGEARAKYGDGLIREYSKKLTIELGKGYSERNLKNMRKFYLFQKGQPVAAKLSWSNYTILLSINDINKMNYYIMICEKEKLSKRKLLEKIKNQEYERLPNKPKKNPDNNYIEKIDNYIKHPVLIKNNHQEEITEKILQKLILEDIVSFLNELGEGFTFIRNEYPIKIGERYNYIDLLLFNIKYNCYVVIELKVTELKKEHIGQIKVYMNYIDKNLKTINQDKTIGIIICKEDNHFLMEYCSDSRIFSTNYITI